MVLIHLCISAQSIGKAHLSQMKCTDWNKSPKKNSSSSICSSSSWPATLPPPLSFTLISYILIIPPSVTLCPPPLPPSSSVFLSSFHLSLHSSPTFSLHPFCFFFLFKPFYSHSVQLYLCFSLCLSPLVVNQSWLGAERAREELPSGSMPLNDLFKDPFRTCKTRSDRALKHEGTHFTSNSLPDLPSGREMGLPV